MLRIAFQDVERVEVSELEQQLPEPSYTIRTVRHLQKSYPDQNWFLCIGEDSLATFHKWHRYRELLNLVTLLVAERPGVESDSVDREILLKTIFADHQPVDISSTGIRETVQIEGENLQLPPGVREYIREKGLYGGEF